MFLPSIITIIEYHPSSLANSFVVCGCSNFSNAAGGVSNKPQHIRDSLQDSQGALYELGVCDDGTFVGLLEDELEESLDTLRLMASKLGCVVWVLRRVSVGEITPEDAARNHSEVRRSGEWDDREDMGRRRGLKAGKLWVAEAFVKPIISKEDGEHLAGSTTSRTTFEDSLVGRGNTFPPDTEQLKISLTGTTTSGKSTLLGMLTTSQPDNGRGKSRLSLFRHRHELVSGVTSSVAQEILGYQSYSTHNYGGGEVINYSYGNISSWTDVHTAISNTTNFADTDRSGRIVFLSDTAGHLRYRRTTIRSLVGWAPHYALMLIPGDEDGLSDSSRRHLHLVLKLELRLIVLITKLDIARRESLRKVLAELLGSLRNAGMEPATINSGEKSFGSWSDKEERGVRSLIQRIGKLDQENPGTGRTVVPIVFTSSVSGAGIGSLHALLRGLPIPTEGKREQKIRKSTQNGLVPAESSSLVEINQEITEGSMKAEDGDVVDQGVFEADEPSGTVVVDDHDQPVETLFHIEEVYALPHSYTYSHSPESSIGGSVSSEPLEGAIISGHLRYGRISVGDELVIGPFSQRNPDVSLNLRGREMTRSVSTGSLPSRKKMYSGLLPTNSSLLSASSTGSWSGRNSLSDEDGTGVSSGDEHQRNYKMRQPLSVTPKGRALSRVVFGEDAVEHNHCRGEWKVARVVSVRRLRLPVGTLFEGEAGTVGLVCLGVFKSFSTPEIKVDTLKEEEEDGENDKVNSSKLNYMVGGLGSTTNIIKQDATGLKNKAEYTEGTPITTGKAVSFDTPRLVGSGFNGDPTVRLGFRLRKGMVAINKSLPTWANDKVEWPRAYGGFITEFIHEEDATGSDDSGGGRSVTAMDLAIGTHVVVYCASIRAAARVVETPAPFDTTTVDCGAGLEFSTGVTNKPGSQPIPSAEVDLFRFEDEDERSEDGDDFNHEAKSKVFVTFEFLGGSEWLEVGAKVLVMSGQGIGLDGVVGKVVHVGL